jgi:hypothetical protein
LKDCSEEGEPKRKQHRCRKGDLRTEDNRPLLESEIDRYQHPIGGKNDGVHMGLNDDIDKLMFAMDNKCNVEEQMSVEEISNSIVDDLSPAIELKQTPFYKKM